MRLAKLVLPVTIITTMLAGTLLPAYSQNTTKSTLITGIAESPRDGSLWIATQTEGVIRISRNGNRLAFSEKGGQLASNNIIGITFDQEGELLIFDANGNLTTYTSTGGFQKKRLETGPTKSIFHDRKNNRVLISSVTKIFQYNLTTKTISPFIDNIDDPTIILPSDKDSTVWILTESGIKMARPDGEGKTWEQGSSISELIPLTFETYSPKMASDKEKGGSSPWGLLWICLGFVCGLAIGWTVIPTVRHKKSPKTAKAEEPAVIASQNPQKPVAANVGHEPKKEAEPVKKSSEPVTKSEGSFTRQIEELIDKNLADKDFDVESIAALMGISRIHVNRKLKAEGSPSPSTLIKDKRMAKAKDLLLQGEITVSQIAETCGFRSSSYFTTAFKEYTGLTPSEFTARKRP